MLGWVSVWRCVVCVCVCVVGDGAIIKIATKKKNRIWSKIHCKLNQALSIFQTVHGEHGKKPSFNLFVSWARCSNSKCVLCDILRKWNCCIFFVPAACAAHPHKAHTSTHTTHSAECNRNMAVAGMPEVYFLKHLMKMRPLSQRLLSGGLKKAAILK